MKAISVVEYSLMGTRSRTGGAAALTAAPAAAKRKMYDAVLSHHQRGLVCCLIFNWRTMQLPSRRDPLMATCRNSSV